MKTTNQPQTEQPTTDVNREIVSLSKSRPNYHSFEERGTLNSTIQALYMPSVEEFFTEIYY